MASVDGGAPVEIFGSWTPGQRLLGMTIDGRQRTVQVDAPGPQAGSCTTRGASHKVQVLDPHVAELSVHMIEKAPPDLSRLLLAPMPGLLTRLDVEDRRQGRAGPAGRGDGSDEDGKHPPRAQGGDGQGDAGEGRRKRRRRSGHRGV